MRLASDYAKRLATETARLLVLVAAGAAWAAPAYLAFVLHHDPHVRVRPDVLTILTSIDTPLMVLAPLLAVFGTIVVSRVTFENAALDVTSAVAAVVVIGVFFALSVSVRQTPSMLLMGVVDRVQVAVALAGIALTGAAIWRRSPLGALAWVLLFAGAVVFLWVSSQPLTGGDPDITRGLRSFAAETVTEVAVWVSALTVFVVRGAKGGRRSCIHLTSASSGQCEVE